MKNILASAFIVFLMMAPLVSKAQTCSELFAESGTADLGRPAGARDLVKRSGKWRGYRFLETGFVFANPEAVHAGLNSLRGKKELTTIEDTILGSQYTGFAKGSRLSRGKAEVVVVWDPTFVGPFSQSATQQPSRDVIKEIMRESIAEISQTLPAVLDTENKENLILYTAKTLDRLFERSESKRTKGFSLSLVLQTELSKQTARSGVSHGNHNLTISTSDFGPNIEVDGKSRISPATRYSRATSRTPPAKMKDSDYVSSPSGTSVEFGSVWHRSPQISEETRLLRIVVRLELYDPSPWPLVFRASD